jgi:hypothetical protein
MPCSSGGSQSAGRIEFLRHALSRARLRTGGSERTVGRVGRAALLTGALLAALAGCGNDGQGSPPRAPASGDAARAGRDPVQVVARGAHLGRGRKDIRLLKIPRVGRLLVACDNAGRSSTAFRLGDRTASSDLVVQRGDRVANAAVDPGERFDPGFGGLEAGIELWRISFFTKAQAAIATVTVAARPLGSEWGEQEGCAISAEARVFQSADGTLTR